MSDKVDSGRLAQVEIVAAAWDAVFRKGRALNLMQRKGFGDDQYGFTDERVGAILKSIPRNLNALWRSQEAQPANGTSYEDVLISLKAVADQGDELMRKRVRISYLELMKNHLRLRLEAWSEEFKAYGYELIEIYRNRVHSVYSSGAKILLEANALFEMLSFDGTKVSEATRALLAIPYEPDFIQGVALHIYGALATRAIEKGLYVDYLNHLFSFETDERIQREDEVLEMLIGNGYERLRTGKMLLEQFSTEFARDSDPGEGEGGASSTPSGGGSALPPISTPYAARAAQAIHNSSYLLTCQTQHSRLSY